MLALAYNSAAYMTLNDQFHRSPDENETPRAHSFFSKGEKSVHVGVKVHRPCARVCVWLCVF